MYCDASAQILASWSYWLGRYKQVYLKTTYKKNACQRDRFYILSFMSRKWMWAEILIGDEFLVGLQVFKIPGF